MHRRWIEAALLISLAMTILAATISGPASAQQGQQPSIVQDEQSGAPAAPPARAPRSRGGKPAPAFEHDPDLDAQDQFAPSQVQQQMPDAVAMPSGGRARTRAAAPGTD